MLFVCHSCSWKSLWAMVKSRAPAHRDGMARSWPGVGRGRGKRRPRVNINLPRATRPCPDRGCRRGRAPWPRRTTGPSCRPSLTPAPPSRTSLGWTRKGRMAPRRKVSRHCMGSGWHGQQGPCDATGCMGRGRRLWGLGAATTRCPFLT